jgi:hypothetical protein
MRLTAATLVATAVTLGAACSGDDDAGLVPDADGPTTTSTAPSATEETTVPVEAPGTTEAHGGPATTSPSEPTQPSEPPGPTLSTTTVAATFPVVEVPESGVPGLDSDDSFCAAWSRFGGTWQVVQVAANFAPDPAVVPVMEVTAAPVVGAAYDAMLAAWPAELASERDAVADGYFGPLDRRAEAALAALVSAGASDADLDALARAWEAALAGRRADEPVVVAELDDRLQALVDAAAAEFAAQRVDFVDDPSMRITVETPSTDAYLATACPDQGALTGGEVDG